jgi:hypothetical protein
VNSTLLAIAVALLGSEILSLVRYWRRCGRVERALAARWDATIQRIEAAEPRRRSLN